MPHAGAGVSAAFWSEPKLPPFVEQCAGPESRIDCPNRNSERAMARVPHIKPKCLAAEPPYSLYVASPEGVPACSGHGSDKAHIVILTEGSLKDVSILSASILARHGLDYGSSTG